MYCTCVTIYLLFPGCTGDIANSKHSPVFATFQIERLKQLYPWEVGLQSRREGVTLSFLLPYVVSLISYTLSYINVRELFLGPKLYPTPSLYFPSPLLPSLLSPFSSSHSLPSPSPALPTHLPQPLPQPCQVEKAASSFSKAAELKYVLLYQMCMSEPSNFQALVESNLNIPVWHSPPLSLFPHC